MPSVARIASGFDDFSISIWNPKDVLKIGLNGRCIGYAPSQRRECHNPVASRDTIRMETLISDLASQTPDVNAIRSMLYTLAQLGLCKRNHQYQASDMVDKWTDLIRKRFTVPVGRNTATPRRTSARTTSSVSARQSSLPPSSPAALAPVSRPPNRVPADPISPPSRASPHNEPSRREQELENLLRVMLASVNELRTTVNRLEANQSRVRSDLNRRQASTDDRSHPTSSAPQSPIISRVQTTDIPALRLSRTSSSASASSSASTSTVTSAATSNAPSATSSASSSATASPVLRPRSPIVPVSPTAAHEPCPQTHVRRRQLDEECTICYDGDLLSDMPLSELVWCKTSCGRSVHKECFELWSRQCASRGGPATCTICRASWAPQCPCDEAPARST